MMTKEEIDKYLEKIVRIDFNDGSFICGELDKYGMTEFPVKDYMVYSDYTKLRGFYLKDIKDIGEAVEKDLYLDEINCINTSMIKTKEYMSSLMDSYARYYARLQLLYRTLGDAEK